MLCETCKTIPLDMFLPTRLHRRSPENRIGWIGKMQHLKDTPAGPSALEKLETNLQEGCEICRLIKNALDGSETSEEGLIPFAPQSVALRHGKYSWGMADHYRGPEDSGIILRLVAEGVLNILDDSRVGNLNWTVPSMNSGYKRSSPIAESPVDPVLLAHCSKWVLTCDEQHKHCSHPVSFAPRHLVEIESDGNLRLIVTTGESITAPSYVALSYCWGKGQSFQPTTNENLAGRLKSIPKSELCPTFLDAIRITQELGKKHLWIDALCIVQNDSLMMRTERKRMQSVYAGAYLTIAATCASDGEQGFLQPRDPVLVHGLTFLAKNNRSKIGGSLMQGYDGRFGSDPESVEVTVFPTLVQPWLNALHGPLSRRAWALQERELSPRVLHFTAERVLFECKECIASEDKAEMQRKGDVDRTVVWYESPTRAIDVDRKPSQNAARGTIESFQSWEKTIEAYSRRDLSVKTDKLTALAGLACEVGSRDTSNQYLAGIWLTQALTSLAWFPDVSQDYLELQELSEANQDNLPPKYDSKSLKDAVEGLTLQGEPDAAWSASLPDSGIPSWSWASFDGPVWFWGNDWFAASWQNVVLPNGETEYKKVSDSAKVLKASTEVSGDDIYGATSGGSMQLLGQTVELELSEALFSNELSSQFIRKVYVGQLGSAIANSEDPEKKTVPDKSPESMAFVLVYFDNDLNTLPTGIYLCLRLGSGTSPRGGPGDRDCGLVLVPSISKPGAYRRVGLFDVGKKEQAWTSFRSMREVTIV